MVILQIEHKVHNYEGWKKTFDSDPIDRKKMGTCGYRISRPTDDPDYVVIDLEFENLQSAEATLTALRKLWNKVEGTIMIGPKTRILQVEESKDMSL